MELRDYIELGIAKTESKTVKELADLIGMDRANLSTAKSHRSGIAPYAATRLAQLIGVDALEVIAASELVTEKSEEKRKFWSPFVEHARAASYALAMGLAMMFVTTSPAEASQIGNMQSGQFLLCQIRRAKNGMLSAWQSLSEFFAGLLISTFSPSRATG